MNTQKSVFYSKMKELDADYVRFHALVAQTQGSGERLEERISFLKSEIDRSSMVLRDTVAHGSSPALSMLAGIHLNYCEQMEALRKTLSQYMGDSRQDQAEALALYAENAMDFAAQAVRFALLAALEAIQIQPDETEENA